MIATTLTLITTLSFNVSDALSAKKPFKSTVMHKMEVESKTYGGTLIFSDSPEYVKDNGILYSDIVEGDCRILFYHLNESTVNKRLAVIVENVHDGFNTVDITRGAITNPNWDFLKVGKNVQTQYMSKSFHSSIYMLKEDKKLLVDEISSYLIRPQQLIYGVYDFNAAHKIKITVLMYPQAADPLSFVNHAKIFDKDQQRLRGTYKGMNRLLKAKEKYNPNTDGIKYIMIADDVNDIFVSGIDSTDESVVKNVGNYGINYTIELETTGKTKIGLVPLGGVYAGAMRDLNKNKLLETPSKRIYFGEKTPKEPESVKKAREEGLTLLTTYTEIEYLGTYEGKVKFEYTPPGASNLPVELILMPEEETK